MAPFVPRKLNFDIKPIKKRCKCSKSQCLQLYCICFANGELCDDCDCQNCHNNEQFNGQRLRSVEEYQQRNPNAFKAKEFGENGKTLIKGCKCSRSMCQKRYCECFKANVDCNQNCVCRNCLNNKCTEDECKDEYDDDEEDEKSVEKMLADLTKDIPVEDLSNITPIELKDEVIDKINEAIGTDTVAKEEEEGYIDVAQNANSIENIPKYQLLDETLIKSATACMLARARYCERLKLPMCRVEREVLSEFNRCFKEILKTNQS